MTYSQRDWEKAIWDARAEGIEQRKKLQAKIFRLSLRLSKARSELYEHQKNPWRILELFTEATSKAVRVGLRNDLFVAILATLVSDVLRVRMKAENGGYEYGDDEYLALAIAALQIYLNQGADDIRAAAVRAARNEIVKLYDGATER